MRYLITFSYDGSCFKGYQRQKGLKTVQGVIENELSILNNKKVTINSSGRTDVGVHARHQKAHFDLDKDIELFKIKAYLNKRLSKEIYIIDVVKVDNNFHARYDCIKKEYRYFINIGEYNIFERNYIYQYNKSLNIELMKEAIQLFKGTINFKSLCNDSHERINFTRTIFTSSIACENDIITISIVGDGFLKQMIRNIVGLLIAIGTYKININYIKEILEKEDRSYNIKGAPSCGLYLWEVYYK